MFLFNIFLSLVLVFKVYLFVYLFIVVDGHLLTDPKRVTHSFGRDIYKEKSK